MKVSAHRAASKVMNRGAKNRLELSKKSKQGEDPRYSRCLAQFRTKSNEKFHARSRDRKLRNRYFDVKWKPIEKSPTVSRRKIGLTV